MSDLRSGSVMSTAWQGGPTATAHDESAACTEEVGHLPTGGGALFHTLTTPDAPTTAAVVICPSIGTDLIANYRREVALSRALARLGIASVRFHCRGTGNSGGAETDITLSGMASDARHALDALRDRHPGAPIGVVGSRWGALAAVATALEDRPRPLVLWDPVLDPDDVFPEGFRIYRTREMLNGNRDAMSSEEMRHQLRTGGTVDLLGHTFTAALHNGLDAADPLGDLEAAGPGAAHVSTFAGSPAAARTRQFADALAARGWRVDTDTADASANWWLIEGPSPFNHRLVDATAGWLADALLGGAR
ncbi:serine aminopeptidase domain-containing protein [Longispora urticae]